MATKHKVVSENEFDVVSKENTGVAVDDDSDVAVAYSSGLVREGRQLKEYMTVEVNLDKFDIVTDGDSGSGTAEITFDDVADAIKGIWDTVFGDDDGGSGGDTDNSTKTVVIKCSGKCDGMTINM